MSTPIDIGQVIKATHSLHSTLVGIKAVNIHPLPDVLLVSIMGDLTVTGDIRLTHADVAEEFDVFSTSSQDIIEPGTVMILNDDGSISPSNKAYDKKVTGIVSGAGQCKPALVLDKKNSNESIRLPIALMGKVYCKVDATKSSIEVGDLLTTSNTKGHAMKADDHFRAFGTVIGKALGSIERGIGLIPVLVALQ